MVRRFAICTLLLCIPAVPARGGAQAPVVTPKGDPSVLSDTIYRLAVDSAEHRSESFVYLLDDGIVRFEADGRARTTYRQVVQILTREAAEQWGEQSFGYSSDRQRLTVNWIRVVRPDGSVISDKPLHEQESVAPVAQSAPIYSDTKIRRVSIGGIAPGTLLDFSYTTEDLKPVMPGDFATGWRVTTGRLTRRSRLIVDVPASLQPRIEERNVAFPRAVREGNGRRVYTWATADVPKLEREPFAADSNGIDVAIDVSAPITWSDIARWYTGLAKDRYALTPEIEGQLGLVVAGARTLDDSIRAVHRWVAQDFRYVSLSLGQGGVQPRAPRDVFAAKYGDCKDKATFFIALMAKMGVRAYPVLLSSRGGVRRAYPSMRQFDHMIAAIARPSGYTYVDLTSDLTPFGELPPAEPGEFGLVVHPDGHGEEITFPADSIGFNRSWSRVSGELDATGSFRGHYVVTHGGAQQYAVRGMLSTPLSDVQRDRILRSMANGLFEGSHGDSLALFDGRDLRASPRVSFALRADHVITDAGGVEILTLPLPNYASLSLVQDLESRSARRFPIDAEAVLGARETVSELVVTLPDGWKARLPPSVSEPGPFGLYEARYEQAGRELRVVRRIRGAKGILPPDQIGALITWIRALSKDDEKYIVLERPR